MSFLLLEVPSLSTGTHRSKPYGQDCMRLRFREAVNKTRIGFTWFWDYAAEPRSYRIWMRGYKYLLPALFLSSSLQPLHSFITKISGSRWHVRCLFFQKNDKQFVDERLLFLSLLPKTY
jgi:hypothetical protein